MIDFGLFFQRVDACARGLVVREIFAGQRPMSEMMLKGVVGPRYYDRTGREVTLEEYIAIRSADPDGSGTVVAYDVVAGADVLSTVWLGLDFNICNLFGTGRPHIFETALFRGDGRNSFWRWATEEEARAGHTHILAELRAGRDPDAIEDPSDVIG